MKRFTRKAQGATEYALFIAAVLAALLALQIYFSRAIRGQVKEKADSISSQLNTEDGSYVRETRSASARSSHRGFDADAPDSWSASDVETSEDVGVTAQGMRDGVFSGTYAGGEWQESEYVTEDTFDNGDYGDSEAGVANHGNVVEGDRNVFEDAQVD